MMNFLKGIWRWTRGHLDWVLIGANAVIVAAVIYYTVQSSAIAYKYELQNLQLFEQNLKLNEQNEALGGVINSAIKSYNLQQEVIQKQRGIIDIQGEAVKKLIERNKFLEAILNGDIT